MAPTIAARLERISAVHHASSTKYGGWARTDMSLTSPDFESTAVVCCDLKRFFAAMRLNSLPLVYKNLSLRHPRLSQIVGV